MIIKHNADGYRLEILACMKATLTYPKWSGAYRKEDTIMNKYLVQKIYDDYEGEVFSEIMTEYQVIKFLNFLDLYEGFLDYKIFDLSEFGKIKELHYTGWQPA